MTYTPRKDTQFSGTEKLTNLTANSGGAIDLSASTTVSVPTVAGTVDSTTKAASTAFVQAVAGTLATQSYVDNAVQGLDWKASARVATTSALAITGRTSTTLTLGGTTLTVDGIALANNDRIIVKDSTTGTGAGTWDNGIYTVGGIGTSVVLTRALDMDTWTEVPGAVIPVEVGTANADKAFISTADQGGTLGTTAISWSGFSIGSLSGDGSYTSVSAGVVSAVVPASGTGLATLGTAQTIAGAKTFSAAVTISAALTGVLLNVASTTGQSTIQVTSTTGTTAAVSFVTNGLGVGSVGGDGSSNMVIKNNAGVAAILINNTTSGVTLGNSTGPLTSLATTPAASDSSTNVANTAFVQGAVRHKTILGPVANASFPVTLTASGGIPADDVVLCNQTSNVVVNLPAASTVNAGAIITIKDISASGAAIFTITVTRNGTDTIDGLTTYVINSNLEAVDLVCDGVSKWYMV